MSGMFLFFGAFIRGEFFGRIPHNLCGVATAFIDANLQKSFQVLQHLLRRSCRSVSLNRLAILVDNELGEVPFDSVEKHATLLLLQVLPQRVGRLAVHVNLVEQIELDFPVSDKALDLFGGAGFLVIELIARESENAKT